MPEQKKAQVREDLLADLRALPELPTEPLVWVTPKGNHVPVTRELVRVLAAVDLVFPGSRIREFRRLRKEAA
jgi:hypothetical protein